VVPARFALSGGAPSPFGRGTVIRFAIPRRTHVALSIYSASGALVKVLCNSSLVPARYSIAWDGRDWRGRKVAPGIYYCRMRAAEFLATRKLIKTE
jgi:flagellar hook assembly protein FlgD